MNVELLQKVKAAILAEPERFDMSRFFAGTPKRHTAAFIAGWALALASEQSIDEAKLERASVHSLPTDIAGQEALELTDKEKDLLFYSDGWPEPFISRFKIAHWQGNKRKAARIAADRIDHFLQTGE